MGLTNGSIPLRTSGGIKARLNGIHFKTVFCSRLIFHRLYEANRFKRSNVSPFSGAYRSVRARGAGRVRRGTVGRPGAKCATARPEGRGEPRVAET